MGNGIGGALRLVALVGQRSLECFCGLLVNHRVREGVPGYGGPGDEGELILAGFRLRDLMAFLVVSDIIIVVLVNKVGVSGCSP